VEKLPIKETLETLAAARALHRHLGMLPCSQDAHRNILAVISELKSSLGNAIDQADFVVWLATQQNYDDDTFAVSTSPDRCPIAVYLRERHRIDATVVGGYWRPKDPNEFANEFSLPEWACRFVAEIDERFGLRRGVTVREALKVLAHVCATNEVSRT